jgi:hypothetical protein
MGEGSTGGVKTRQSKLMVIEISGRSGRQFWTLFISMKSIA